MSRQACVLGLGASGLAASSLLAREGHTVIGVDRDPTEAARALVTRIGATCHTASQLPELPAGSLVIVSPGIPADHPWIVTACTRGMEVISELELGFRYSSVPVLAVTGSNGKSSVTKLCGEAIALGGHTVAVGGNYGTPYCDLLLQPGRVDWIVLEVSSFQLEWVDAFRPRVGLLLNVYPNHLDRHGDMETYAATKLRLFSSMGVGDTAVIPVDWADRTRLACGDTCDCVTFGPRDADYAYVRGLVKSRAGLECRIDGSLYDNPVLGPHAAAALAALVAAGLGAETVERAILEATALPYRMQPVASRNGISFVNDSKATNLASMCAAVQMCPGPVRLIAGGRLKEKNLQKAKELLANRVRTVYLIGEASERMFSAWHDGVECLECGTLENAVEHACEESQAGEVVLLSPGCASFDQFSGFAQRGERFEELVSAIGEGEQG